MSPAWGQDFAADTAATTGEDDFVGMDAVAWKPTLVAQLLHYARTPSFRDEYDQCVQSDQTNRLADRSFQIDVENLRKTGK